MSRILLIRHCEATGQGVDGALTPRGEEQAVELAAWLRGRYDIDRIVASHMRRAVKTIEPYAVLKGIAIEQDERIVERRLANSYFENQDVWLNAVRNSIEDPALRFEGGETGAETLARGWSVVQAALAGSNGLTALVSHGQMSTHLLRNIDPSFGFDGWRAMTNPDVFAIETRSNGRLYIKRVWEG